MHTEIIRIIEGGLNKDSEKVANYARLFAENLRKKGDLKMADRIEKTLTGRSFTSGTTDQLNPAPVDSESRLAVADIVHPGKEASEIVLSPQIEEVRNKIISLYEHRSILEEAGVDVNNSALLYGPPGCGKTTLANNIAYSLQLPLVVARFDALVSSLLGSTAKNIRRVFEFASNKPCVLLLDEFDAIGKARDDQHELGELKRVINSLLQNIDRFVQTGNLLIAATNHPELLDKAIWRRFNFIVEMGNPSADQTKELLAHYLSKANPLFLKDKKDMNVALAALANLTPSNLKTICNNAIADAVVFRSGELSLASFLLNVHSFNTNNKNDLVSLVRFLSDYGIPKETISTVCKIGIRKVNGIIPPGSKP